MSQEKDERQEEGIEIPLDRLDPDTLLNLIKEFVSREWSDLQDSCFNLDDKIGKVMEQLEHNKARIVFDLATKTWNIVVRH